MDKQLIKDQDKFAKLSRSIYNLCKKNEWGDPFSYGRHREIDMAIKLGHTVASTYAGADGFDKRNRPVEYKATINSKVSATYNGISVMPTLKAQISYIKNKKIGKYANHYIARYEGPNIVELWKMNTKDVLRILLPKIKKSYNKASRKTAADPRIGVQLTRKDIEENGKRII